MGVVEGMLPENWVCDECQIRRQVCFGVTCAVVHSSPFTPHPSSARAPARRARASCHFFSGCGYVTDHGLLVSRSFTRLPLAIPHAWQVEFDQDATGSSSASSGRSTRGKAGKVPEEEGTGGGGDDVNYIFRHVLLNYLGRRSHEEATVKYSFQFAVSQWAHDLPMQSSKDEDAQAIDEKSLRLLLRRRLPDIMAAKAAPMLSTAGTLKINRQVRNADYVLLAVLYSHVLLTASSLLLVFLHHHSHSILFLYDGVCVCACVCSSKSVTALCTSRKIVSWTASCAAYRKVRVQHEVFNTRLHFATAGESDVF